MFLASNCVHTPPLSAPRISIPQFARCVILLATRSRGLAIADLSAPFPALLRPRIFQGLLAARLLPKALDPFLVGRPLRDTAPRGHAQYRRSPPRAERLDGSIRKLRRALVVVRRRRIKIVDEQFPAHGRWLRKPQQRQ